MRSRRTTTLTIACLVAFLAALPAAASAGSLLSGYGGPGQGSQVILGSSLIKGGGGSGGPSNGGGSNGGGEPTTAAGAQTAAPATVSAVTSHSTRPHTASGTSRHGVAGGGPGKQVRVAGSVQAHPAFSAAVPARAEPEGPTTVGVSRENLLYVLLALGALIFTGLLTKRMARPVAASRHG
jgi:hypothetical protein